MKALILQLLKEMQNKGSLKFYENHPLSLVSTFGIGGEAGVFVLINNKDDLCSLITLMHEYYPYKIIGNASNLLFADEGFKGAIISTRGIASIKLSCPTDSAVTKDPGDQKIIIADCGCTLPRLCGFAMQNGISGFEGLCSIPATVGGAIINNAGAFGCEISDNLIGCEVFYPEKLQRKLILLTKKDFGYRHSRFKRDNCVILTAYFSVKSGNSNAIFLKMEENRSARALLQPTGVKSAGSFFKRPLPDSGYTQYRGKSAGELIDICGLKGASIGGAYISEKHGNFIINPHGNATANDVISLSEIVKKEVYSRCGIQLTEEVETVPY